MQPAIDFITQAIQNIINVADNLIQFFANVFTGNWEAAWENVKTIFINIFESIVAYLKLPLNTIIGMVNGAIKSINNFNITLPNWGFLGDLAGKSFSPCIPEIPYLATGGNVLDSGAYIAGENGPELITNTPGATVLRSDRTQKLLSSFKSAKKGNTEVQSDSSFAYNPTFVIQGNADKETIESANKMGLAEFERLYNKMKEKNKRVQFA